MLLYNRACWYISITEPGKKPRAPAAMAEIERTIEAAAEEQQMARQQQREMEARLRLATEAAAPLSEVGRPALPVVCLCCWQDMRALF